MTWKYLLSGKLLPLIILFGVNSKGMTVNTLMNHLNKTHSSEDKVTAL